MENFLILFRFTNQGRTRIKESPNRVKQAKDLFSQHDVKVKDFYMLMGEYDTMFIAEAKDSASMAKACLAINALGNVTTETLHAFSEAEYEKLVGSIS